MHFSILKILNAPKKIIENVLTKNIFS